MSSDDRKDSRQTCRSDRNLRSKPRKLVVFPEPDQTSQFTLAASGSRQETVRELDSERAVLTDSVCVSPSATVGDQYTPKTAVGAQCLELLNQSAASLRRLSFSPSVHTHTHRGPSGGEDFISRVCERNIGRVIVPVEPEKGFPGRHWPCCYR